MLSDNLCSLLEKKRRFALCMDVDISPDGYIIGEPRFSNALICVKTNHSYNSTKLLHDQQYKRAMEITQRLNHNIRDSHELVEFWMVYMNAVCGKHLAKQNIGIFRSVRLKESRDSKFDNPNTQMFFNNFENISSEYSIAVDSVRHDTLGVESYAQITSPIRRLVDLINQTLLLKSINVCSERSDNFTHSWLGRIDELNVTMKSIKRVQNDCELMRICYDKCEQYDTGVIFDESIKDGVYKYRVYLENLNTISYLKSVEKIEVNTIRKVRLYLFASESEKKRKIRLEIMKKG